MSHRIRIKNIYIMCVCEVCDVRWKLFGKTPFWHLLDTALYPNVFAGRTTSECRSARVAATSPTRSASSDSGTQTSRSSSHGMRPRCLTVVLRPNHDSRIGDSGLNPIFEDLGLIRFVFVPTLPDGAQRGPAGGPVVQRELLEDVRDGPSEAVDPSHDLGRGQGHLLRRWISVKLSSTLRGSALGLVKDPLCQELLVIAALHYGPLRPRDGARWLPDTWLELAFSPCLLH